MSDRLTPRQLNRTGQARQRLLERVQREATSALAFEPDAAAREVRVE